MDYVDLSNDEEYRAAMALLERSPITETAGNWDIVLRAGKTWNSFEQFRVEGGTGMVEAIPDGAVGFLRVREVEFAILRRRDFGRILGIAQDVRRFSRGIPLLRQAAELVSKSTDQELAIRHFSELTVSLSDVVTSGPVPFDDADLALEPSETSIDLDTFAPPRATTTEQ